MGKVAYVVSIPQSTTAHQAPDRKYYKRYDFKREAMEDYEIRDVMIMNRLKSPLIRPSFSAKHIDTSGTVHEYALIVKLTNEGAVLANNIKLVLSIPKTLSKAVSGFEQYPVEIGSSIFGNIWFKNSLLSHGWYNGHIIFPEDEWIVSDRKDYRFDYVVDTSRYDLNESRGPFLFWKIYADNMPPQTGQVFLLQIPRV